MSLDFSKFLDDEDNVSKSPVNPEYNDYEGFKSGSYEDLKDKIDEYENLDVKEQQEKIRKLQIGNEKELRTLIEKKLMVSIMGEIGQSIQSNLVDQAKRNANKWANKLGIPSKERDIEKLISDMLEDGINGVISDIERLCDDGLFE